VKSNLTNLIANCERQFAGSNRDVRKCRDENLLLKLELSRTL
jgi:hypothetical protein